MKTTFTAWITKYALTAGIEEMLVEQNDKFLPNVVTCVIKSRYDSQCFYGKQWHRTRDDAVKRAEQMRQDKIVSLQKQIRRLVALKFK